MKLQVGKGALRKEGISRRRHGPERCRAKNWPWQQQLILRLSFLSTLTCPHGGDTGTAFSSWRPSLYTHLHRALLTDVSLGSDSHRWLWHLPSFVSLVTQRNMCFLPLITDDCGGNVREDKGHVTLGAWVFHLGL